MQPIKNRYSKITKKLPREMLLLQGMGCFWKKCSYCDYYLDVSKNPFEINKPVIDKITGEFKTLDVINSGSAMELDCKTLEYLIKKISECKIETLWIESHWFYRYNHAKFAEKFKNVDVKFRFGIETFNPFLREKLNKGVSKQLTGDDIAKFYNGICLLVGFFGQTYKDILNDIQIANKFFEYFSINVFAENSKFLTCDKFLIDKFCGNVYPKIVHNPKIEILINCTDLGVG